MHQQVERRQFDPSLASLSVSRECEQVSGSTIDAGAVSAPNPEHLLATTIYLPDYAEAPSCREVVSLSDRAAIWQYFV